jgi:hypothetical protein
VKAPSWFPRPGAFAEAALLLYGTRALLGWFVALPIVQVVEQSGIGLLERGDAALFQPGGLHLLELVREQSAGLRAGLETSIFLGVTTLIVLAVPQALLFARAPKTLREHGGSLRVLSVAPRFLGVGVLEALGVALVAVVFAITSAAVAASFGASTSEPERDLARLAVLLPGLGAMNLIAILADIVRLELVRGPTRLLRALPTAIDDLRGALGPLLGGFTLASGSSVLLVALGARGTELCRIEEPGALRVVLVALLHQGVLFALVAIQALWVRRLDAVIAMKFEQ